MWLPGFCFNYLYAPDRLQFETVETEPYSKLLTSCRSIAPHYPYCIMGVGIVTVLEDTIWDCCKRKLLEIIFVVLILVMVVSQKSSGNKLLTAMNRYRRQIATLLYLSAVPNLSTGKREL